MKIFDKTTKIDFMSIRRITFVLSIVLLLGSLVILLARGLNLGLDFTGGIEIEVAWSTDPDEEAVRQVLTDGGFNNVMVQQYGASNHTLIRLSADDDNLSAEETDNRVNYMVGLFQDNIDQNLELLRFDEVGSQVGKELTEKGGLAMLVAILLTAIYIAFRFEYRFAIAAAVALLHDPIIILGVFAYFQLEFDLATLAAILAAIGYSLNDTIVIFDRVRENFVKMRKASPIEVMNVSINETLGRTLITSLLTLVVLVVLLFFGGPSLFGFSLALTIGVVVGTYSSVYVAGALAITLGLSRADLLPASKEVDDRP